MLFQPVHPESNIGHLRRCSLWGSALWIFLKTYLPVRKINLKIIFATSLAFVSVSRPTLVNLYLTVFVFFWCVLCQPVQAK